MGLLLVSVGALGLFIGLTAAGPASWVAVIAGGAAIGVGLRVSRP